MSTIQHRVLIGIIGVLSGVLGLGVAAADDSRELLTAEELIDILDPEKRIATPKGNSGRFRGSRGLGGVRPGNAPPFEPPTAEVGRKSKSSQGLEPRVAQARQGFSNILFGTDSFEILRESYSQLDEIGKALQAILSAHPATSFVVEGHTDDTGSARYNEKLSFDRAEAVRAHLVERFGIDGERLSAIGHGEGKPVVSNSSESDRKLNRRVEIARD